MEGTAIGYEDGKATDSGWENTPVRVRPQVPCGKPRHSLDGPLTSAPFKMPVVNSGEQRKLELGRMMETPGALVATHLEYVLFVLWHIEGGMEAGVISELHNVMGELRTDEWFKTDRVETFLERYKGQQTFIIDLTRYLRCKINCEKDEFIRELQEHVTGNGLRGAGCSLQCAGQLDVDRAVAGYYAGTISGKSRAPY